MSAALQNLCVIFDIDGTLCDTNAVDDHCYRCAAAAALGIPAAQVDWASVDEITDSAIARCLWQRHRTRAPSPAEMKAFQFDFVRRLQAEQLTDAERFQPVRAAPTFLDSLGRAGAIVGIGTGGWRLSAEFKLRTAGIPTELLYATADDSEVRTDIFSLAYQRARGKGVASLDTVLVGDTVRDVATARKLGWRFLGIGSGPKAAELCIAGARTVVPNYVDLEPQTLLQRAFAPAAA